MSKRMMVIASVLAALTALFWSSQLDEAVSRLIYSLRFSALTEMMKGISWLGYVYFLVPINILILIGLFRKDRLMALTIPLGTLFVWQLSEMMKKWVGRPRPDIAPLVTETSFSFPSGHAMSNTAFYLLIMMFLPNNKYIRYICISMIVLMNFSRVYLGVHWPSDVLGGSAIAMIMLHLILSLIKKRLPEPSPSGIDE